MDLRDFFKRIREIEAAITSAEAMVVSFATPDGGKADVATEVPRNIAARLIAEGKARLATPDEATAHGDAMRAKADAAEKAALAERVQVAFVSDLDFEGLKKTRSKKG